MTSEPDPLPVFRSALGLLQDHDITFVADVLHGFLSHEPIASAKSYDLVRLVLGSLAEDLTEMARKVGERQ